jgi:repressor LexA
LYGEVLTVEHNVTKVATGKERFSEIFDESEKTATELAKELHVSKQTLSAWRIGTRSPKEPTVMAIANYFNVDPLWLFGFDVKKEKTVRKYDNIAPIRSIHRQSIPMIGSVAAGEPVLTNESFDVFVDSPIQADYALRVEGDSMDPTYQNGDIVYIRETPDVPDGTVAVVLIDDSACLKHVYKIHNGVMLVSDNPSYPPMTKTWPEYDTIRILGTVVGFTRMFGRRPL